MAIEPKSPRKRAVKKLRGKLKGEENTATQAEQSNELQSEVTDTPKRGKKAAAVPVPVFQAAEIVAPKSRKTVKEDASTDSDSDDSPRGRNRRRRRGGRGRCHVAARHGRQRHRAHAPHPGGPPGHARGEGRGADSP